MREGVPVEERQARKLAIILHADVVGSTALVQRHETLAHERIQDAFRRFSKTIEAYGGMTLELRGDALVAEFDRASDAVSAALAFQAGNKKFNVALDDDIQPELRIGISVGEVVIADNTVTGAGVVLAQRLEQLAKPSGVCIQGAAYETVPQRLPFSYESLGEQEVKGFEQPVRTYAVTLKPGEAIPPPEPHAVPVEVPSKRASRQWIAVGTVAVFIIVGGALAWLQPWQPREEPASMARMAFPLPEKPSLAVLPFENMSEDSRQDYFADGITEDLITDLSKISGLFVIARNSTFTYKGKAVKVQRVAEELGVRFVLEGSVRRAGDQVRINAQLVDATTGGHVWADRYDGSLADVFALQDRVTQRIIAELAVRLSPEEKARQGVRETNDPNAYSAFLKGWYSFLRATPQDFAKAVSHFNEAIQRDPDYGRAHAALAALFRAARSRGWQSSLGLSPDDALEKSMAHLQEAKRHPTPLYHQVASRFLLSAGEHNDAITEAERAVTLDPNDPAGYFALARALIFAGRPSEGVGFLNRAMRLDPHYPPGYLFYLGVARFGIRDYETAADLLEKAKKLAPDDRGIFTFLIASYGYLEKTTEARSNLLLLHKVAMSAPVDWMLSITVLEADIWPYMNIGDLEHLQEGLRKAGMPEFLDEWDLDPKRKLTGEEIRTLIFGRTIEGQHPVSKIEFIISWTEAGAFTAQGFWTDTGTSRIAGDRVCNEWTRYEESCAVIYRNPDGTRQQRNEYLLVQRSGAFPFSPTS